MRQLLAALVIVSGWTWLATRAAALPNDWAEGTPGKDNGATRDFYNRAGQLSWTHRMGDWHDAENQPQGNVPYATAQVGSPQKESFVEWDVTKLVQQWLSAAHANLGFFLRVSDGQGDFQFASREHESAASRPHLVLSTGETKTSLSPSADTHLEGSTYRCLGQATQLRVSGRLNHALLRFDLSQIRNPPDRAVLRLFLSAHTSGASAKIGVFRCQQGQTVAATEPVLGLAARYPADRGLADDPAVVFFCDFESPDWRQEWTAVNNAQHSTAVADDPPRKFSPWQGQALSANLAQGESTALNTLYKFQRQTGSEPEEIHFRYYLRLGDDWNQTVEGGKLPGLSGTYGVAGWGGRKANGQNGWSARGSFSLTIPADNPLAGLQPIGTYCYHADQPGFYGDVWIWQQGYRGFLEKNRWYCVEQQVRLNQPDQSNGLIRAWIDGRPAFEKTGLRFRTVERLKIEQVWMNVYHGGTRPSPYDQHLYVDNVAVARSYIGPMAPAP